MKPPASLPMIQFEIPPNLEIQYANIVRISHSPLEFVFDFSQTLPGNPNARVCARLVMSPQASKLLYRALGENLTRYETANGEINLPVNSSLADHLFRPRQNPDSPSEDNSHE